MWCQRRCDFDHYHQYPTDEARVGPGGDPLRAWSEDSEDFFRNHIIVEEPYTSDDWLAFWTQELMTHV